MGRLVIAPSRQGLGRAGAALAVSVIVTIAGPVGPADADGNEAPADPVASRSFSAGGAHACVVITTGASNGRVKCWGAAASGQLGLSNTFDRGDQPDSMGGFLPSPQLGTGRTATAVTTGNGHTCARLDDATVKCWGNNGAGRLGLGDTDNRGDGANEMGDSLPTVNLGAGRTATAVTAGSTHTCALLDNATVKCWGNNASGQLGLGDTSHRGDAAGEMGNSLPTVNLGAGRTATAITAGTQFTCAILDNATVKCWGNNASGQLGQGDTNNRGDAAGEMGGNLAAVNLGAGRTATAISAGGSHVCVILDNNTVKCWGLNATGQLGQGDANTRGDGANEMGGNLAAISLGTGRTALGVSASSEHTCARLDNSTVKCWGANADGRLGHASGNITPRGDGAGEMGDSLVATNLGTGRTATAVTTGGDFSCASLDNGDRKCWGANGNGRLGQEDTFQRGHFNSDMGNNLDPIKLPPVGLLGGTIVDEDTGQPVPDVFVVILRSADFSLAATTDAEHATGQWVVSVPPGTYFAYLIDPSTTHADGFLESPPGIARLFTATDGITSNVPGAEMVSNRGGFSGTVEGDTEGLLDGVRVLALGPTGIAAMTVTAFGQYTIGGLPPGTYHAVFIDGAGRHTVEYWDDAPDFGSSASFNVTAGAITPDIDAELARP